MHAVHCLIISQCVRCKGSVRFDLSRLLYGTNIMLCDSGWGRGLSDLTRLQDAVINVHCSCDLLDLTRQQSATCTAGPLQGH